MRPSIHGTRSALSAGLIVLLFAPTLVGGHAHVADHDASEHHVDVPHGAHELSLTDSRDQMPSTHVSIVAAAHPVVVLDPGLLQKLVRVGVDDTTWIPLARGPPRAVRSRAPPLFL